MLSVRSRVFLPHAMVDFKTAYLQKFEIYVCTQPDGPNKQQNNTVSIVNRLAELINCTGRDNITLDNWYTSIPLAKDNNTSLLVWYSKKKQKGNSITLFTSKTTKVHSSKFGFSKELTFVSNTLKNSELSTLPRNLRRRLLKDANLSNSGRTSSGLKDRYPLCAKCNDRKTKTKSGKCNFYDSCVK